MEEQPVFQLVSIGKDGQLVLESTEDAFKQMSSLGFVMQTMSKGFVYYDAKGNCWACELVPHAFKNNLLNRLLALTFHNPTIRVSAHWTNLRAYQFGELKQAIAGCIDKDDDIITQFEEGDWIKQAVDGAADFSNLVNVLRKYVFEVDETSLWQEQDARLR